MESMQDVLPIILFAMTCVAFLHFSPSTRVDQKDSDNTCNNAANDARKVEPFPWEPRVPHMSQVETKQFKNANEQNSREEMEQLQFLATMTFAGGLRAPSCPCCQ